MLGSSRMCFMQQKLYVQSQILKFINIYMKKNPQIVFDNIIKIVIKKVTTHLQTHKKEQLEDFNQRIKLADNIKQLDANKFFFLFEEIIQLPHVQPVEETLKQIQMLIVQNYLIPSKQLSIYESFLKIVSKHLHKHCDLVANILIEIKVSKLEILKLLLQAYSICTHENLLKKIKSSGLIIISRIFGFRQRQLDEFTLKLYNLYKPTYPTAHEFHLVNSEEENLLLNYYINKILLEMVDKVEVQLTPEISQKRGKFGWCFICRNPAQFYCKDTKVAICGADCKKLHLEELGNLSGLTISYSTQAKMQVERYLFGLIFSPSLPNLRLLAIEYVTLIAMYTDYKINSNFQIFNQNGNYTSEVKRTYFYYIFLYHSQRNEFSEHIISDLYMYSENNDEYRLHAQNYFKELFRSPRLFVVYYNFDLNEDRKNLVKDLLQFSHKTNKHFCRSLVEILINNVYNSHQESIVELEYIKKCENKIRLVETFNTNTDKAVEELKLMDSTNSCLHIAKFIKKNQKSLNREKLGSFFGRANTEAKQVLEHFLELLDITKFEIDEALREIFYYFAVSESQQIYRIIEVFSAKYSCKQLLNQDQIFQFSYFLLMLQTELHNPSIDKRMTFEEMCRRVKDFNPRLSEDRDHLKKVYKNIRSKAYTQYDKKLHTTGFESYPIQKMHTYNKVCLLYDNWSLIYVVLASEKGANTNKLIYRVASLLIDQGVCSQSFLILLIKQLQEIKLFEKEVTEDQVFTIYAVMNLLWQNPNVIQNEWTKVFILIEQYYKLIQKASIETRTLYAKNVQKLKHILSESQINKIIHNTVKLTDAKLEIFCQKLLESKCKYLTVEFNNVLMLNAQRVNLIWEYFKQFYRLQENYMIKIQNLGEIIVFLAKLIHHGQQRNNQKCLQQLFDEINWQKSHEYIFVDNIVDIIKECTSFLSITLWRIVISKFKTLDVEHQIHVCKIMKNMKCPLYEQFIVDQIIGQQSNEFFKYNCDAILEKPSLLYQRFKQLKNRQIIKGLLVPAFSDFIIANLDIFDHYSEIYTIIKSKEKQINIQQALKFINRHISHLDLQMISLVVRLMISHPDNSNDVFVVFSKIIQLSEIQFPAYEVVPIKLGQESIAPQPINFNLSYATIVKKSVIQLGILKELTQNINQIDLDKYDLVNIIVKLLNTSRAFNRNIRLRYLLWKDGLLKQLKQLPGLLKKQRNCQHLLFLMLNIKTKKGQSPGFYASQFTKFINDTTSRFQEFIRWNTYYKSAHREDINYHYLNEIEREIVDYKKIIGNPISHFMGLNWQSVQKRILKQLIESLVKICKVGLFKYTEGKLIFQVTKQELDIEKLISALLNSM